MHKNHDSFNAIIKKHIDISATHFNHLQNDKIYFSVGNKIYKLKNKLIIVIIIVIIYHDFLPTPRRGSHVKSGKTHTQSSRYTP